jgi:hypothetical protein
MRICIPAMTGIRPGTALSHRRAGACSVCALRAKCLVRGLRRHISIAIMALVVPTLAEAQGARNCSEAAAKCQLEGSNKPNIKQKCEAAGARCRQTGVFVGPVTGRRWTIPKR